MSAAHEVPITLPRENARLLSMWRLQATLTVFIVVLLLAMSGLMMAIVSRIFDSVTAEVRADLTWKVQRGTGELSHRLELAVAVGDRQLLADSVKDYTADSDVRAIVVTDGSGKTVYQHGTPPATIFGGPAEVAQAGHDHLTAWIPVVIEGTEVGRIALVVSTKRLDAGQALRRMLLGVVVAGSVIAIGLALLFAKLYVGPIVRLAQETVSQLRELAATLEERVRRRTGELVSSMEKLRKTQAELAKASHSAGMADVATSVLHNVGNVLNSANVSTTLVADRLRKSKSLGLVKAVELLRANAGDPAAFLTQDPRGKKLPDYFGLVSDAIQEERAGMMTELDQLTRNLDHIRVIISMQQNYAKASGGHVEILSLKELLDEALAFNQISYAKHEVEIVRDYDDLPAAAVDRHKVFQILMNLLSNARHAVKDVPGGEKRITVRLERLGQRKVAIEIQDTGVGIAPDVMSRLFQHGFTTKKEGHGFGLHSSANAAKELGGTLVCSSAGAGKGSTFRLEMPFPALGSVEESVAA